jgi:energy-coupling factor transporter ATP-binding protein EcfA2
MHLQRIQVPDFRVLKDVDITFEKEFVPSIFPLGSLNGGGKSTLLQLVFVLLHCSNDPDKIMFLKNMLNGFKIYKNYEKRVLSIVEIWHGDKIIKLEFFSYKDSYIKKILLNQNENIESKSSDEADEKIDDEADYKAEDDDYLKFSVIEKRKNALSELIKKAVAISEIEKSFEQLKQEAIKQGLSQAKTEIKELKDKYKQLGIYSEKVDGYLQSERLIYICKYSVNEDEDEVLLCKINNLEINKSAAFLKELSQKVFLAAPATQVFLFISKESKKLLFRDISNDKNDENNSYYSELQTAKAELPGFFAYDFLAVDLLIESFKAARDRDFREAIETGEYGNNYKELMKDLNGMLSNKQIELEVDLSGVNFKLVRDGGSIELSPEDLSHGELKRLGIYMWIKYHNIENAIVLMDEIEIAFHPDWQYQIISDLQQWAPSNQYILATHSYELCQALTPSHVKELEPKLLKKQEA